MSEMINAMHKLTLTNNAAALLFQMLSVPGTFATPVDVLRAGKLMEKLETKPPKNNPEEWLDASFGILEISEVQRDLLKRAVEKLADKLPAGKVTCLILEQLGFTE